MRQLTRKSIKKFKVIILCLGILFLLKQKVFTQVWPCDGHDEITAVYCDYDTKSWGFHEGLDIGCPVGTDIIAIRDGTIDLVDTSGTNTGIRIQVTIGTDTFYDWYWHTGNFDPASNEVGETVTQGDHFGESIANSTTHPHMHVSLSDGLTINDTSNDMLNAFSIFTEKDPGDNAPNVEEILFKTPEDRYITNPICGDVDIVAKVTDDMNYTDWRAGIYKIGYWIDEVAGGHDVGSAASPEILVEFLDNMPPATQFDAVYDSDKVVEVHPTGTKYKNYHYIVTNTGPDATNSWNSAELVGGSPVFPNGLYDIHVYAWDARNNLAGRGEMTLRVRVQNSDDVDLFIKDHIHDDNTTPSSSTDAHWWTSPEIWIDNNDDGVQDDPVPGSTNHLYAGFRNLGHQPASNVTVDFYYRSNSTGLAFPDGANHISTDTSITSLPAFGFAKVWVPWDVPLAGPASGHWCIGVVVSCDEESPASSNVTNENNIALVNLFVMYDRGGELVSTEFIIQNSSDGIGRFFLQIDEKALGNWKYRIKDYEIGTPIELGPWEKKKMVIEFIPPDELVHASRAKAVLKQVNADTNEVSGGIDYVLFVDKFAPAQVEDFKAELDSPSKVRLTWSPISQDIEGNTEKIAYYNIYGDSNPKFKPDIEKHTNLIAQIVADEDKSDRGWQFFDTITPSEKYYYLITAVDSSGKGSVLSEYTQVNAPKPVRVPWYIWVILMVLILVIIIMYVSLKKAKARLLR